MPIEKNMLAELRVLAANYEAAVGAGALVRLSVAS